jgi:integrase
MAMMAKVLIPAHGRSRRSSRNRLRDLAVFDLAIDSKLRGCNVVALKVVNVAPNGYAVDRASIRQRKTGRPVRFEIDGANAPSNRRISPPTGRRVQSIPVFRKRSGRSFDHAEYARLLAECLTMIGLDPRFYGTHSLRRTKATLIYKKTGDLRVVQLLLGHTKIESTVSYLGIEVDDALAVAEQIDV